MSDKKIYFKDKDDDWCSAQDNEDVRAVLKKHALTVHDSLPEGVDTSEVYDTFDDDDDGSSIDEHFS